MEDELGFLKALADSTRLKIVEFLLEGEKCVCEIFPHVNRTQSTVSFQLSVLEKSGILKSRRDGKRIFYSIEDMRVCDIFKVLGGKGQNSQGRVCMQNKGRCKI